MKKVLIYILCLFSLTQCSYKEYIEVKPAYMRLMKIECHYNYAALIWQAEQAEYFEAVEYADTNNYRVGQVEKVFIKR